jgi:DNA-binding transcriptional ArsR family regulator
MNERMVEVFRALADATRLDILQLLQRKGRSRCGPVVVGERGLCACDVEAAVGLSQAAISHHMGILRRAGLVEAQKRGRWMFYRRNDEALKKVAAALVSEVRAARGAEQGLGKKASGGY